MNNIPIEKWKIFRTKKVYFGHQSVGANILNGVRSLKKEYPYISIRLIEGKSKNDIEEGAIIHSSIGSNKDPISKINDFTEIIYGGIGNRVDFAFFKFCYIDMYYDTDIESVLRIYKKTMAALKRDFPKTTFVHFTIPLTVVQTGIKALIKRMIGKAVGGYADNIRRNKFNAMIRELYSGNEPLFDLATIESTSPDGQFKTFKHKGQTYNALVQKYASDGRHLNYIGGEYTAKALLLYLLNLMNKSA